MTGGTVRSTKEVEKGSVTGAGKTALVARAGLDATAVSGDEPVIGLLLQAVASDKRAMGMTNADGFMY